jgi:hypothetical protein
VDLPEELFPVFFLIVWEDGLSTDKRFQRLTQLPGMLVLPQEMVQFFLLPLCEAVVQVLLE